MPIINDMTIYSLLFSVVPDILMVILICFFYIFRQTMDVSDMHRIWILSNIWSHGPTLYWLLSGV